MARDVLLIGIPGSGKTSAATGLVDELAHRGRPYGLIESEWLAQADPPLRHADVVRHLALLVATMRAGDRALVVTATPESAAELGALVAAIGGEPLVVWLDAPAAEAASRLREREPHDWAERLIAKGGEIPVEQLAAAAGLRIDTGTLDREAVVAKLAEASG